MNKHLARKHAAADVHLPGRAGPAGLRCRCAARRPASHLHGGEREQTCNSIGRLTALGSSSRPTHSRRTGQEGRRVHDRKWYEACSCSLQMGKEGTSGGAWKVYMTTLQRCGLTPLKHPWTAARASVAAKRGPCEHRHATAEQLHASVTLVLHVVMSSTLECLCAALTVIGPVLCARKARTALGWRPATLHLGN